MAQVGERSWFPRDRTACRAREAEKNAGPARESEEIEVTASAVEGAAGGSERLEGVANAVEIETGIGDPTAVSHSPGGIVWRKAKPPAPQSRRSEP